MFSFVLIVSCTGFCHVVGLSMAPAWDRKGGWLSSISYVTVDGTCLPAPLQLSSVVAEREKGLRQALKTMGMLESAFWLSWMAVEVLASLLFTLLLIAFGAMFQFKFLLTNNFWVVGSCCTQAFCTG